MNPQQILIELCESLEINFETSMLQWEKGPIEEDGVWAKYWYRNVHQSKGFKPYPKTKSNFPIHLNQLLDQCVPYYNELMKFSI